MEESLGVRHRNLLKVNHVNAIVDGYHGAIEHFERVFGAQLNMAIPGNPDNPTRPTPV